MSDYLELDDIKIAQSLVHDLNVSTKMAALMLNERDKTHQVMMNVYLKTH